MYKQIANSFFTRFFSGIFNLLVAIILSNYLGPDGKGVQSLILATISLFIMFGGIIGYGGLTFLLPRFSFSILIIPSYLWSVISISIFGLGIWRFELIQIQYIPHVMVLSFINSITTINNSILHADQKIKEVNNIAIFQNIMTLFAIVYLVIVKQLFSVNAYVIALYISYSASLILSYYYTYANYLEFNLKGEIREYLFGIKKHFKYGGLNQLDLFAQFLTFRFAYYILNYYVDTAQVGIYSNAVSIIESVWILSRSISFVQHSQIVNSTDKKYTSELTVKFIKLSGVMAFFSILILVLIPSKFYQFIFGIGFADMRIAVLALSPGILFFSISFIISSYFSGTGRHYVNSISSLAGLVIIVVSSFILIPKFGIAGAGLAASLSYFATTLIKVISFRKTGEVSFKQMIPRMSDVVEFKNLFDRR